MEISKQLFEDVLSGKLKGVFVLRNKQIIKSTTLKRSSNVDFPYAILIKYDNGITDYGTFKSNGDFEYLSVSYFDIIDFILDTNMKKNELTIEIPNGKIVDWDESKKQNKIVMKDKQLNYEEICEKLLGNNFYFIDRSGSILRGNYSHTPNCAKTEHQLECILAKNKLANVAVYLNDGWKPDFSYNLRIFVIYNESDTDTLEIEDENSLYAKDMGHIIFKSRELAQQAIEILGEETVKLALEPLGI